MPSRRRSGTALALACRVLGCALLGGRSDAEAQSMDMPVDEPPQMNVQHRIENGFHRTGALQATITYNSDTLANVHGGERQGWMYDGRLGLILDTNLDKAFGWSGATAHLSLHAIHGTGSSGDRVGNLLTVSGLEAEPTVRLFNLWVEQQLGEGASLRLGQFSAGQEFMLSSTANLFVNSTFGWPASFAVDLPSGGPAYPLSAPGARLTLSPTRSTTVLAAVFAGDPAGPGSGDPQVRDELGLNGFRFAGRVLLMAEVAQQLTAATNGPVLKLGGWAHLDHFDDLRFDSQGRSLADPVSSGDPRRHSGDSAVYAIVDTPLWTAGHRTLSGFVRVSASPSDRNQIDRYIDFGLSLAGPFAGRPDDTLGLAVGVARISPQGRGLAADANAFNGQDLALPSREAVFEATYQFKLRQTIYVQPDLQYVSRPNAGAADPATQQPLKDAVIVGLRTSLRF